MIRGEAQLDLDKQSFEKVVQEFGAKLQGAEVGLFYYAGHGVQVRGVNYLVPVDANPSREADVGIQMLDAKLIVSQMEGTGTKLNIVILDACRNDPFSGRAIAMGRGRDNEMVKMRDIGGGGLAEMQAPEGTLISFATQPGNTAEDGADGDSPYAAALSEVIRIPGLGIFDSFNQVGLKVKYATGGDSSRGCQIRRSTAPFISSRLKAPRRRRSLFPNRRKKSPGITSKTPPTRNRCGVSSQNSHRACAPARLKRASPRSSRIPEETPAIGSNQIHSPAGARDCRQLVAGCGTRSQAVRTFQGVR